MILGNVGSTSVGFVKNCRNLWNSDFARKDAINLTCIIYEEADVPSRDSVVRSPPHDELSLFSHNIETVYINNGSSLLF